MHALCMHGLEMSIGGSLEAQPNELKRRNVVGDVELGVEEDKGVSAGKVWKA